MKTIKISKWIFWITWLFWMAQNFYFGWNVAAQSKAENICDYIMAVGFFVASMLYFLSITAWLEKKISEDETKTKSGISKDNPFFDN